MERTQGQDLYEVLQVSPRAHPLITKAFRLLAALYHPDNMQTGDEGRFKELGQTYAILGDPERRAAYDREHAMSAVPPDGFGSAMEGEPLESTNRRNGDEAEMRYVILQALYDVRRRQACKRSVSLMVLSELVGCSIERLQSTLWYLRGKRLIETVEDSDLAITVEGVDHLEGGGLGGNGDGPDRGIDRRISLPPPPDGPNEPSPCG
jgi:curved DNA-binding protein